MARDSSGAKNQPVYAGTGAPSDAADLTEVAQFAADVGNRKVGTNTQRLALTGANVWVGLEFFETDTSLVYEYRTGGWTLSRAPGVVRSFAALYTANAVGAATTLGTLVIPAMPVVSRIGIEIAGSLGFAGLSGKFGVDVTASTGTLTMNGDSAVDIASPQWANHVRMGHLILPAATTSTITFKTSGTAAYFRIYAEAVVRLVGEY